MMVTSLHSFVPQVMEKSRLAYKGDFARLKDYRRASVVCPDIPFIIKFVAAIENNPKLLVCRHKNRFDKGYLAKESGGYRDLQLNLVAQGGFIWVSIFFCACSST